ncbi:hypothetical protein WEI85_00520 [Actinomycetes bacterium KLBMP 9797]
MAGWRRWWRITVRWESARDSPTGESVQVVDVASVARLRELVLAACANPLIVTYTYGGHREWWGRPRTCGNGHELLPARCRIEDCLCGGGHFSATCGRCPEVVCVPERGPRCGPVPFDELAGKHWW